MKEFLTFSNDKTSCFSTTQVQKKVEADLELSKAQFHDMERAERLVRVDLEQTSKKVFINSLVSTQNKILWYGYKMYIC